MTTSACRCHDDPNPPPGAQCKLCKRITPGVRHLCHAKGCSRSVPPKMLMCAWHWRMVSPPLQREVWREYRTGQEIRKDPTDAYLDVMRRAIECVAAKESP